MNLAGAMRALVRRWYISIPGILLAVGLAVGVWAAVPPGYERSATQLLLPGTDSIPEDANPFLYLSGLSVAADVVVQGVGAENILDEISTAYPGAAVEVSRDTSTAGPVIVITVTATSDADAEAVLQELVGRTEIVLDELQDSQDVPASARVTVAPITVDGQSVLQQRERLVLTAGVALAVTVLALLLAALVDGLALQRRRQARPSDDETPEPIESPEDSPPDLDTYVLESSALATFDGALDADPAIQAQPHERGSADDPPAGTNSTSVSRNRGIRRSSAAAGESAGNTLIEDDPATQATAP